MFFRRQEEGGRGGDDFTASQLGRRLFLLGSVRLFSRVKRAPKLAAAPLARPLGAKQFNAHYIVTLSIIVVGWLCYAMA